MGEETVIAMGRTQLLELDAARRQARSLGRDTTIAAETNKVEIC